MPCRRSPAIAALLALLLSACAADLVLPAVPQPRLPVVDRFEPDRSYAEQTIRLHGRDLGSQRPTVEVAFEGAAPVAPSALADDGSWLDVVVPLAARTGPVTVTTPRGRGKSGASFTMLGAGRLRNARVEAVRDLRRMVQESIRTGGRLIVRLQDPEASTVRAALGEVDEERGFVRLGARSSVALARGGDNAFLNLAVDEQCLEEECEDVLVLEEWATGRTTPTRRTALGSSRFASFAGLEADPSGRLVVVASVNRLWTVDLTTPQPTVTSVATEISWRGVAPFVGWVSDDRFLVRELDRLRVVDVRSREASREWTPLGEEADYEALRLAVNGGRVVLTDVVGGSLSVFDYAPQVESLFLAGATIDASFAGRRWALAVSDDGRRVAIAWDGAVSTFDTKSGHLLGSVSTEDPNALAAGRDGLFAVGRTGGIDLIAGETGALARRIELRGNWHSPMLLPAVCQEGEAARTVLRVASFAFGEMVTVEPTTLQTIWGCASPEPVLDGRLSVVAPIGSDGRFVTLAQRGSELRLQRHAANATTEGAVVVQRAWPAEYHADTLQAAPDGGALLVGYSELRPCAWSPDEECPVQVVDLVDLAGPWTEETRTIRVPFEGRLRAFGLSGGRIFVAGDVGEEVPHHVVRAFDQRALLRGAATPAWPQRPFDVEVYALALAGSQLLVATQGEHGEQGMAVLDQATGELKGTIPTASYVRGAMLVAPGQRRLWWTAPLSDRTIELQSLGLDLETITSPGMDAPLRLPVTKLLDAALEGWPTELAASADGETLFVSGGEDDRLVQLR